MNGFRHIVIIFFCYTLFGCSIISEDGDDSTTGLAPASIKGKSYEMTVTDGAGFFADSGIFTIRFSSYYSSYGTYRITGDAINVADSYGTYTYSSYGDYVGISVDDSIFADASFTLTFTSLEHGILPGRGTFILQALSDPSSYQSGTFVRYFLD